MRVLVINGPNLNMLGVREPDVYGSSSYSDLEEFIKNSADECSVEVEVFQSNHEGVIVDKIQSAFGDFEGIVINPAAYTHTSIAILDALKAVSIPTVEVHLSDISKREEFRSVSYVSNIAVKSFVGLGFDGYKEAINYLAKMR